MTWLDVWNSDNYGRSIRHGLFCTNPHISSPPFHPPPSLSGTNLTQRTIKNKVPPAAAKHTDGICLSLLMEQKSSRDTEWLKTHLVPSYFCLPRVGSRQGQVRPSTASRPRVVGSRGVGGLLYQPDLYIRNTQPFVLEKSTARLDKPTRSHEVAEPHERSTNCICWEKG